MFAVFIRFTILTWIILNSPLFSSDAVARPIRLEARRLTATDEQLQAEGQVRLTWDADVSSRCTLGADRILLQRGERLTARGAWLESGRLGGRLRASCLDFRPEGGLEARWLSGHLCRCADEPPLLSFSAEAASIHRDGRRLHLRWPVLGLGRTPILPLPYLALPLTTGVSGLLPPEIGYSGRDGVRLLAAGYLAPLDHLDVSLRAGWIQERGGAASVRVRAWHDRLGRGWMQADGLLDGGRMRGSVRGKGHVTWSRLSAGVSPDWVSDGRYASDLDASLARVFAPYLRSRLWGTLDLGPLAVLATGDLLQDLTSASETGSSSSSLRGRLTARLGVLPVHLFGPLTASLSAGVQHDGLLLDDRARPPTDSTPTQTARTLLFLMPRLASEGRLWLLSASASMRYRLFGLLGPAMSTSGEGAGSLEQGVDVMTRLGLPLSRGYRWFGRRVLHVIEPSVGVGLSRGSTPWPLLLDGSSLPTGGYAILGLQTSLLGQTDLGPLRSLLALDTRLLWPLPLDEPGAELRQPLWDSRLRLRPAAWLHVEAHVLHAPEQGDVPLVAGRVCMRIGAFQPCAGYLRLRLDERHDLHPGSWLAQSEDPVLGNLPFSPSPLRADQAHGQVRLDIGPVQWGALLAGDPAVWRFSHARTWLGVSFGCGCYHLAVVGQSRTGQSLPDLAVRLTISPEAGVQGCLGPW